MGRRLRFALGLGAAALIGTVVAVIVSGHSSGRDERTANVPPATQASPPASHLRLRSSWIIEANNVCRLGRKLYPSIALGAKNGDPDTMDYAVTRLVDEIGRIALPTAASARHRRLEGHGQTAVNAWRSLATRPSGEVTIGEQRAAARFAAAYVDELVALGANACAPLRPVDD